MTSRIKRLRLALLFGPGPASGALTHVLAREPSDRSSLDVGATLVANAYAEIFSAIESATLRDAIVRSIQRRPLVRGADDAVLIDLLTLASNIELLESRRLVEDRLWTIARRWSMAGRERSAGHIVGLLAAEGRHRASDFWAKEYQTLGSQSAIGCALGVLRSEGVKACLEWIRVQVGSDASTFALIALVPLMSLIDSDSLLDYANSDDPFFTRRVIQVVDDLDVGLAFGLSASNYLVGKLDIPSVKAAIRRVRSLSVAGDLPERYATL